VLSLRIVRALSLLPLLGLVVLTAVPLAAAQTATTRLIGTVRDDQGGVLPGATVTATGASLIGGQSAVTEANGTYQFPTLPPGTYAVTFELAGFQTVIRDRIVLELGQTLTIDGTLPVGGLAETVVVTTEAPIIDRTTTSIGNVLDAAELAAIPSSTDLWGALTQAPGIRARGFDVGGSHKIQSTGYDAFGITGQVRVMTEGVDQTEGNGGAGFYQDYFANSEVSVSAAGLDVTTNTPGATVLVTVKGGGNRFAGLFNQTYEGRRFVGRNVDAETAARGYTGAPNLLYRETHADLGGPIVRDRLWFFYSRNHFTIDKRQSGIPESLSTDLGIVDTHVTKETWKPSTNDTFLAYFQHQHKQQPKRGLSVTTGPGSTLAQSSFAWMANVRWQRVWNNRLFTEANAGHWGYNFPLRPTQDYRTAPPRLDTITGVNSGAGASPTESNPRKPQAFLSATYFLPTARGSHDLKIGGEWLDDGGRSGETGLSGPIQYRDANGLVNQVRLSDVGNPDTFRDEWLPSSDGNRRLAFYLQDRWAVNDRLSITAGLRYDRQQPYYEESRRVPVLADVFAAAVTPGRTLLTRNVLAPRVGVALDPTGSGLASFKAFYGRYFHNFGGTFSSINPGGTNTRTYVFHDPNGNRLYDGIAELGALVAATGGSTTTFDPELRTPYTDEFNASYQRQFWGQSSVRVAWVRKQTRRQIGTLNEAWIGQFTVPVSRTATLQTFGQASTATAMFQVYDIPSSLRGVVRNVIRNLPASVDGGAATYDTLELAANKRFASGLFVDASADWTRANDLRNANSTSNSPLTQADPIGIAYFENTYPTVGNRQDSSVWSARLSGRYTLPLAVNVAANVRVQSGWNYARVITVNLPNAGNQRFWYDDLSGQRSETVPLVSARLDRSFSVWKTKVTAIVDVFNLINNNAVTNFNLLNGPSFSQVNGALDPRTVQVGLRLEF